MISKVSGSQNSAKICRHFPQGGQYCPGASSGAPMTAIARKSLFPSLIALQTAFCSAHTEINAAFSTLQPVTTLWSAHSNAAPTENPEYGQYADPRAFPAASINCRSETLIFLLIFSRPPSIEKHPVVPHLRFPFPAAPRRFPL
jgi:hypothetical protein